MLVKIMVEKLKRILILLPLFLLRRKNTLLCLIERGILEEMAQEINLAFNKVSVNSDLPFNAKSITVF